MTIPEVIAVRTGEGEEAEALRRELGLPPPEGGFDTPEEWDSVCAAMRAGAAARGRPLTARQREVLAAIVRLHFERRAVPTYAELMRALSIRSPNGIVAHLDALRRRGLVEYQSAYGKSTRAGGFSVRGLRVTVSFAEGEDGERLRAALGEGAGGGL